MNNANGNEVEEKKPNIFSRFKATLQRRVMAGIVALIPLLVTVFVVTFLIENADSLVRGLLNERDLWGVPLDFPGVGVIVFAVAIFVVGLAMASLWGRKSMDVIGRTLSYVPVMGTVYGVTEQLTSSLTSQYNFSRVVLLEWPRDGMMALGFVTGRIYNRDTHISIAVVYVPTVPNPTSGNMAFVNEDDILETDISVELAMRLVFTGGIVMPESMSLARLPRQRSSEVLDEFVGRFHLIGEDGM